MLIRSTCLLLIAIGGACSGGRDDRDDVTTVKRKDAGSAPDASTFIDAGGGLDAGTTLDAGITPDAGFLPDAGDGNDAGLPGNSAPIVTVSVPATVVGDMAVSLRIFDSEANPVSLTVEWSSGSAWKRATIGSPTTGLASSAGGLQREITWRSAADLPIDVDNVLLRVTPFDGRLSGPGATSNAFSVRNAPVPVNHPPAVTLNVPFSSARGDMSISFTHSDPDGDTLACALQRSTNGTSWSALTTPGFNGTIASGPSPTTNPVSWASATDYPATASSVTIRVVCVDPGQLSASATSGMIAVDNVVPTTTAGVKISEISTGTPDWIELANTSMNAVDLQGWKLTVDALSLRTIDLRSSGSFPLGAGARVVVTVESGTTSASTIYLSNASTTAVMGLEPAIPTKVELIDAQGAVADTVLWEGYPTPSTNFSQSVRVYHAHPTGTLQRKADADTDDARDWCTAAPTRGASNGPCFPTIPSSPLRLSEIASEDSGTSFVEIVNTGSTVQDPVNWVLVVNTAGAPISISSFPSVSLQGLAKQAVGLAGLTINANTAGSAELRDPSGKPHDVVRWRKYVGNLVPGTTWPDAQTSVVPPRRAWSLSRTPDASTTVTAASWCNAPVTRNTTNGACRPAPQNAGLLINEVAAGAFFGGAGFIEIANRNGSSRDLEDYELLFSGFLSTGGGSAIGPALLNANGLGYFDECNPLSPAAGCIGTFGWGGLTGGSAGYVELVDFTGKSVDFVRFGGDANVPEPGGTWSDSPTPLPAITDGASFGRKTGVSTDSNSPADWCKQSKTKGNANGACIQ